MSARLPGPLILYSYDHQESPTRPAGEGFYACTLLVISFNLADNT